MCGRLYIKLEVQVVWKAWYWGTWLGARKMQAVFMKAVTSSSVAKRNFLGRPNTLNLRERQCFVPDTAFQSTEWKDMLAIWGDMAPLPPRLRLWLQGKRKNSTCLMFNLRLTKSSQKQKTARHCRMKSTIVSIGCYVWFLATGLLANGDCWSSITVVLNLGPIESLGFDGAVSRMKWLREPHLARGPWFGDSWPITSSRGDQLGAREPHVALCPVSCGCYVTTRSPTK